MEDEHHLCCITAVYESSFTVMFYRVPLNYEIIFLFLLQKGKDAKMKVADSLSIKRRPNTYFQVDLKVLTNMRKKNK